MMLTFAQYRPWPQAGEAWASGRHRIKYFSGHKIIKCDFSLVVLRLMALVRGHGFNVPVTRTFNFGLYFILASSLQTCRTGVMCFKRHRLFSSFSCLHTPCCIGISNKNRHGVPIKVENTGPLYCHLKGISLNS